MHGPKAWASIEGLLKRLEAVFHAKIPLCPIVHPLLSIILKSNNFLFVIIYLTLFFIYFLVQPTPCFHVQFRRIVADR